MTEMLAHKGGVVDILATRHKRMANEGGNESGNNGTGNDANAETSRGASKDLGHDLVDREGERGRRQHKARPNKACGYGRIPSRPHE